MSIRHWGTRAGLVAALVVMSICLLAAATPIAGAGSHHVLNLASSTSLAVTTPAASHQGTRTSATPGKPTAKAPTGAIATTKPTFKWSKAARATRYEVRVYKSKTLVLKKTGIRKLSWTSSKVLPANVDLTWKVRARNGAGNGAWSKSRAFKEAAPAANDIAFSLDGDMWAISPDGGAPLRLSTGSPWDYGPAWSPDRSRIAFIRRPSRDTPELEHTVVWVLDFSGAGTPTRLEYQGPSLATATEDLAWSPDGRLLAGACRANPNNRFSKPQVTVLDLETMRSRVVYTPNVVSGPSVSSLDWSPDSTQLFVCTQWADPGPTYRVDVASGQLLQDYFEGAYAVSWGRADGNLLLDEFGADAMYRIQMRSVDGSLVRTLWDQSDDRQSGNVEWLPTYSPDGNQYAFFYTTKNHLYLKRANLDGSGAVIVRELNQNGFTLWGNLAWK